MNETDAIINAFLHEREQEIIDTVENIVNIDSGSRNIGRNNRGRHSFERTARTVRNWGYNSDQVRSRASTCCAY